MGLKQFLHHITRQKGLNITNPNGQPYNFTGWNDLNTKWIDLEDIEKDEFFAIAYKRLKQMGELEQHYLTDRARYVCRKPE